MGLPGPETALMCRVLGDLIQDGSVAKLADDSYGGGNTPEQLLFNFKKVLHAPQAIMQFTFLSMQNRHMPTFYYNTRMDVVLRIIICKPTSRSIIDKVPST